MPRSAPTSPVGVNVRVDHARPRAEVVADLQAAGLEVERVLGNLGVVSGTVPADGLQRLADVDGVTAVERDRTVTVAARPA